MPRALAAVEDGLWQFAELFTGLQGLGVAGGDVTAADAAGAVRLEQAEQAAQHVRAVLQPTFQGGQVDQGGVLGQQGAPGQFVVVGQQVQGQKTQLCIDRDRQLYGGEIEVVAQLQGCGGLGQGIAQLRTQVEQFGTGGVELGFDAQQPGIGVGVVLGRIAVDAVDLRHKPVQAQNAVQMPGRQATVPQADGMVGVQGQLHLATQAAERGVGGQGHGQRAHTTIDTTGWQARQVLSLGNGSEVQPGLQTL